MKAVHAIASLAYAIALAGCVSLFPPEDKAPAFRDPAMTVQQAGSAAVAGRSTKAAVAAALGAATVVKFDSGYEVWVYRVQETAATKGKTEFVILFSPAGIVKKTRVRQPPLLV